MPNVRKTIVGVACIAAAVALSTRCSAPTAPVDSKLPDRTYQVSGVVRDQSGEVIEGALVEAPSVTAVTDVTGKYQFLSVISGTSDLAGRVSKAGFHSTYWKVLVGSRSGAVTLDLSMVRAFLVLPIDGSIALDVSPEDVTQYVGEIYYSDTCYNCRPLRWTTPPDADVRVILEGGLQNDQYWLQLWALDGALKGTIGAPGAKLTLPRGRTGTLLVGAEIPGVNQKLSFRLVTTSLR